MTAFAEKSGIPIVSTMMGIGVMPMGSPVYLGMIGRYGRSYAKPGHRAKRTSSSSAAPGWGTGPSPCPTRLPSRPRTIHIDIDPRGDWQEHAGRTSPLWGT